MIPSFAYEIKLKYPKGLIFIAFMVLTTMRLSGQCWSFSLDDNPSTISQSMFPGAIGGYFPDAGISVLEIDSNYYAFWAMFENYRSIASSPLLQNHVGQLDPATAVFGGREPNNGTSNGFNDGGMWFIGVRKLDDGRLAGFFHAESHWYPRSTYGGTAYKSIGVAYSEDNGLTWGTPELILKHFYDKPATPDWSGLGDGCVIYNHLKNRYYCYYTPVFGSVNLSMAISEDPAGAPGTWMKWYNGSFSQPGIGGFHSPIDGLSGRPGANPSVHWNTYLEKFIIVFHGWNEKLYISASEDGEVWEEPQLLLDEGSKTWYPVVVGTNSSEGGQTVTLYYGNNFQSDGRRTLSYRTLTFNKGLLETTDQLLADGRYAIRNMSNNRNLAATSASGFDGVLVSPDSFEDQRWDVTHLGNNEYRITHACCGGRLAVENSNCTSGSLVLSETADDSRDSQIWKVEQLTNGNFVLRPKHCQTQALARADASSDDVVTLNYNVCNELQAWSFLAENFALPVTNFKIQGVSETCRNRNDGSISISAVRFLNYTAVITGNGYNSTDTFTMSLTKAGLSAGDYRICISVQDQPGFGQCFNVTINQPEELSVLSKVNKDKGVVSLNMNGSDTYKVNLNGVSTETKNPFIELQLKAGENKITVETDKNCQGKYEETIFYGRELFLFPNPVADHVSLFFGESDNNTVSVKIVSLLGNEVYSQITRKPVLTVDTSGLTNGMYVIQVASETYTKSLKIIKQ
ncbi:T9SS type A sorting domain-containing protein [Aestuariivivens sediminicola]|uniref:T9SS type A sorting domain-containing protein n=1 Tax=Aestuariivivens sediminicola TaxID=2913560 RepID=UPI001F57E741|nr:T9SS type A sorting domain-containing protein [Aestuariivivens sediminicola]